MNAIDVLCVRKTGHIVGATYYSEYWQEPYTAVHINEQTRDVTVYWHQREQYETHHIQRDNDEVIIG